MNCPNGPGAYGGRPLVRAKIRSLDSPVPRLLAVFCLRERKNIRSFFFSLKK